MAEKKVRDTRIRTCEPFVGADGKKWLRAVVEWESLSFSPGQYVMAASQAEPLNWPTPLMIQEAAEQGFTVFLHPNSPLYAAAAGGVPLTVWGPCGTGIEIGIGDRVALLTDAPGLILVSPYAQGFPECTTVILAGRVSGGTPHGIPVKMSGSLSEAAEGAARHGTAQIIAALPLRRLAELIPMLPPEAADRTCVFVGARIGCGIGGCKGCFIAGGEKSYGVAVCRKGPFLPLRDVDFKRDQASLAHYI